MNYWHMQLHEENPNDTKDHIYKILEKGYIGLGDWKNGNIQIEQFKNNMQKGDIVLIRQKGAVALVEVVGDYQYESNPDTSLDWFPHKRKIKILSRYSDRFNLPKNLGSAYYATTLQACSTFSGNINNGNYTIGDYIEKWYKLVKKEQEEMIFKEKIDLLEFQKQIILQGPPGTGKTRLAKQMAIKMINDSLPIDNNNDIKNSLSQINSDQVKLIQFHPSYSYEDFVRGIVARSTNNGNNISYETEDKVLAKMAKSAKEDLDKAANREKPKKYILIIDEINRANLSSVLGELIYALEYRNEAVESMYELNGSREVTLPSNLYIIGTMNTADRSIGHIDYAIRRRFAFDDILPVEAEADKDSKFKDVELLFKDINGKRAKTLSPEFEPDRVMLGHSYFIGDKDELEKKLKYQVVPLLKEYVSDGVLTDEAISIIDTL